MFKKPLAGFLANGSLELSQMSSIKRTGILENRKLTLNIETNKNCFLLLALCLMVILNHLILSSKSLILGEKRLLILLSQNSKWLNFLTWKASKQTELVLKFWLIADTIFEPFYMNDAANSGAVGPQITSFHSLLFHYNADAGGGGRLIPNYRHCPCRACTCLFSG